MTKLRYEVHNSQTGEMLWATPSYRAACRYAFAKMDADTAMRAGLSSASQVTDEIRDRYEEAYLGVVDTEGSNGRFISMVL